MPGRLKLAYILFLLALAGLAGAVSGAAVFLSTGGGRILPGVSVGDQPLGWLTREQARRALAWYGQNIVARPVVLEAPGRTVALRPADFGFRLDVAKTVARAFAVGRSGPWSARLRTFGRLWTGGVRVTPVLSGRPAALQRFLVELAAGLAEPPRNARFDPETGRFIPEAPGREVAVEESVQRVSAAFLSLERRRVALGVRSVKPAVTLAQLRKAGIRRVLASYTTRFDPADENRAHNIRLAAAALDGALIRPGEVFSFNRATGEHTEARGYRPAYEIVREKFVIGIGGGVCQVSSTLYNAALLAGLQVPERTAHSQPLGYVPPGRDATVYDGLIDLKLRNNRSHPVALSAAVGRDYLTVAILGQEEDFPEAKLELGPLEPVEPGPEVVEFDPALAPGERKVVEESRLGYRVKLYRKFYRRGVQVATELVSQDFYPPRPRRVKVGPPTSPALDGPFRLPALNRRGVDLSTPVLYN